MKKFIKKVATGPKGNEDLNFEEANEAMKFILSKDVSDVERASFLVGWRLKPETSEEFLGALQAIYDKTHFSPMENSFELGFPFDGKNDSPYLFPLVGKILKQVGVNLIVTGDDRIPAKEGVTVKMLHQALAGSALSLNYNYFDRADYCPSLSALSSMRNQIGLRTGLNTLEKFSLVAQSKYGASGVFHKPYVEKYEAIFKTHLNAMVFVGGNEGCPELMKKSKVWFMNNLENDQAVEVVISPEEFGIEPLGFEKELSLTDHVALLSDPSENLIKLAALNAAIYMRIMKPEKSVAEYFNIFQEK